jgi:hypothetical protein
VLPKELEDIFDEYEEDDFSLYVTRAEYGKEFKLDFHLQVQDINDKGEISQMWTVETVGYRKCQVSFGFADFLKIFSDSPLLWEFSDNHGELYFTGQIKDSAKLFVDLYKTHKELFGDYQKLDLQFSENILCSGNVRFSNGLIAKGPRNLLEHYAKCLIQNGLNFSIIGEWRPTIDDGFKHVPESHNLYVLFLGNTYIIANKFLFTKQVENSR